MIRSLRWIALLVLVLVPSLVEAEVTVPASCRIKNRPPGRCGWCAIETVARQMKIETLYGITDSHSCRSCPADLETALTEAGVPYLIQYPGTSDTAMLKTAISKGRGAVVGFRELRPAPAPTSSPSSTSALTA